MKKLLFVLLLPLVASANEPINKSDYTVALRPANYIAQVNTAFDECSDLYSQQLNKPKYDNFLPKFRELFNNKLKHDLANGGYSPYAVSDKTINSPAQLTLIKKRIQSDKAYICTALLENLSLYTTDRFDLSQIGSLDDILTKHDFEYYTAEPEEQQKMAFKHLETEELIKKRSQNKEQEKRDEEHKKYQAEQNALRIKTALEIYGKTPQRYNTLCDNYSVTLFRNAMAYKSAYHGKIPLAQADNYAKTEMGVFPYNSLKHLLTFGNDDIKKLIFSGKESTSEIQYFLRNFDNRCLIEYDKSQIVPDSQKLIDYSKRN